MSVFTEIDRRLRHSVLARAQPFIRARTPWLHKALLVFRELVLPFRSPFGLTRYQHTAIERFCTFTSDRSGAVLEIGSDLDGNVLKELKSRGYANVVGINVEVKAASRNGAATDAVRGRIIQADVRSLPFKDDSIASVVSIMAFEHVHDLPLALRELHRVLKPGGIVYSDFGPIWSCSIGHHVYAVVDGVEARHWKPGKNPVPHFAHLLMSPVQLRAAVLEKAWVFPRLADAIVSWIYEGDGVNRTFYEEYVRFFDASPFKVRHLVPVREHVPRITRARLERACPGHREFSVRMVEVVLEKARQIK